MADQVDDANELAELELQARLSKARRVSKSHQRAVSHCLNCQELLTEKGTRYCDSDCREDHEKRVKHHAATWAGR
ncbi:hypothetical protein [Endozoicomonas sp. ALC066]|uniref:hypothetical protein n=1 Tax=Endozoicomonas sp. ALC066 TaxID=3403078 RepID=UPI003BB48BC2